MGDKPKILALAGSTRAASYNKKLVRIAAEGARQAGAEVTYLDLREYPLPLYDGDLEEQDALPVNAQSLKEIFKAHSGLLLASPEYNSSISGVLKNTIDWVSRPLEGEAPLAAFTGKVCGIMSASPGALGGLRGLVPVRLLLGNIGVVVLPDQVAVSKAHEAFIADDRLNDPKQQAAVEQLGRNVAEMLFKLQA